jgi:hypothetical protein
VVELPVERDVGAAHRNAAARMASIPRSEAAGGYGIAIKAEAIMRDE